MSDWLPTPPLPIAPPPIPAAVAQSVDVASPKQQLSAVRWPIPLLIGLVLLNLVFVILSGTVFGRAGILDFFTPDGGAIVLTVVITLQYLPPLLIALWWAKSQGVRLGDAFLFREFGVLQGVLSAVGIAFAGRGFSIWYAAATQAVGIKAPATPDVTQLFPFTPVGVAATVLMAVVIAPIAEEALFRGVLFSGLKDRLGSLPGLVLSAAIFAAVHFSLYQFIPLFVFGLMLAYLVSTTRSILPAILCHALFNAVAVGLLYLLRWNGVLA